MTMETEEERKADLVWLLGIFLLILPTVVLVASVYQMLDFTILLFGTGVWIIGVMVMSMAYSHTKSIRSQE